MNRGKILIILFVFILLVTFVNAKLYGPYNGYMYWNKSLNESLIYFIYMGDGYISPAFLCSYQRDINVWGSSPYPRTKESAYSSPS